MDLKTSQNGQDVRKWKGRLFSGGPTHRAPQPSHRQVRAARATAVGLWVLVGLAAIGGVAGILAFASRSSGTDAGPAAEAGTSSVAAEGFAELYVKTWLTAGEGEEDTLSPFSADEVSLRGRKPGSQRASWVGTVGSRLVEPGYWSVTVAAALEEAAGTTWRPVGLGYYQVPVLAQGDRLVVTGLPAQVPAPAKSDRPQLDMTPNNPLPPGEVADTLERFFGAYLAGQGDVERYVRPGAQVRAVDPPPFSKTTVAAGQVRELGDSAAVAVQVEGTDAAGRTTTTAYDLRLLRRDGRWEVAEVLAAPPLYHPDTQQKGAPK